MSQNNIIFLENEVTGTSCTCEREGVCVVAECDELLSEAEEEAYRGFKSLIAAKVAEKAGPDFEISLKKVLKNNSVVLDSLVILRKGMTISPSFYLNDFYDDYRNGMPSDVIAERILTQYGSCMKGVNADVVGDFSFETMKNRIVFKLINYEMNRELLRDTPHIRYQDLAVIFCCLARVDRQGMGTIRITNEHCARWGVDVDTLKACAMENAPYIMPYSFKNIFSVIAEILMDESDRLCTGNGDCDMVGDIVSSLEEDSEMRKGNSIYVLSNRDRINGAACLLYDGLLEDIRERLGCGFYILPSSVHEVIIVPDSTGSGRAVFEDMVPEVNREQVPEADILSNRVYHYPEDDFRI